MGEKKESKGSKLKKEPSDDSNKSAERVTDDNIWNENGNDESNEGSHNPLEEAELKRRDFPGDLL